MGKKSTYEELEQRVKRLEKEAEKDKQIEHGLANTEEMLEYMLNISTTILYRCAPRDPYHTTFMSKNIKQQLGYEPEDFTDDPQFWVSHIHPDDAEQILSQLPSLSKKGYHDHEYRFLHKDGTYRWIYDSLRLLRNAEGKLIDIIGNWTDITEQKEAREALKKSEELYKSLVENVTIGVALIDLGHNVIMANRTHGKMLNKHPNELIGKKCFQEFEKRNQVCPHCPGVQAMKTGQTAEAETVAVRDDGTKFNVRICAFPVFGLNGAVTGFVEIVEDITKRKQAEEEIKRSKEFSTKILNNSPNPILYINKDTSIRYVNPSLERLTGFSSEELVGTKPPYPFWPKESVKEIQKDFKSAMLKGARALEKVFQKKTGEHFWVEITSLPITHKDKLDYYLSNWVDITERKSAEEEKKKLESQLQMSQRMEAIGTLAGGIAHDFNNLLMGIQGNTSLMFQDIDSSHSHYERLKSIEKQIKSGVKLTSQLLGYASKGRYEVKPTNLNQMVEETSMAFGRTRKQITIHRNLTEDLFAIEADQGQIEQVLLNLFINAADAMHGGGDLYLETKDVTHKDMKSGLYKSKAGNYVKLTVTDTGEGMDKSTMERIFDPFFTTKEMGRGTGLGLASVYGIIKAHGGYIDVESKVKQGTTFEIYLPATTKRVSKAKKASEKLIKQTGTILLVDDEATVLKVCISLLEKIGYSVLTASNGKEAIELYRNNKDEIDIVLLDMIMPNMSGGEVYDCIKEINPGVKVLLSSGYSIDGEATDILNRGCDGFIQKPFNIEKLSAKISKVLNNK